MQFIPRRASDSVSKPLPIKVDIYVEKATKIKATRTENHTRIELAALKKFGIFTFLIVKRGLNQKILI